MKHHYNTFHIFSIIAANIAIVIAITLFLWSNSVKATDKSYEFTPLYPGANINSLPKLTPYSTDHAHDPDVIRSGNACQNAVELFDASYAGTSCFRGSCNEKYLNGLYYDYDNWKNHDDKATFHRDKSTDEDVKYLRHLYDLCVENNYCSKEGDFAQVRSNLGGKTGNIDNTTISDAGICGNAFRVMTPQACIDEFDGKDTEEMEVIVGHRDLTNDHSVNMSNRQGTFARKYVECTLNQQAQKNKHGKRGDNDSTVPLCNSHKKKIDCSVAKGEIADSKGKTEEETKIKTLITNQTRDMQTYICSYLSSIALNNDLSECSSKIQKAVTDCINQLVDKTKDKDGNTHVDKVLTKLSNTKPGEDNDIYKCIKNTKGLNLKLPDKLDIDFNAAQTPKDDSDQKKCYNNAGFFGFFWCPGLTLLTNALDSFIRLITGGLKWTILANNASTPKASGGAQDITLRVWGNLVAVANIAIAIAFIVMLYSYAVNSSNSFRDYTAKKLLSRLIIVTVAVNLSFYICAGLADLSNIAGEGIFNLITGIIGDTTKFYNKSNLLGAISGIIAGVALIAIALMSLGTASLALLIVLALISLRQIALLILVILSPVAFACYLLPNTEKWFRKWWDYYIRLLIVYPMFMAVWVFSRLMLAVLDDMNQNDLIKTALAAVAPLLSIIPIFKMSGGLMNTMAEKAQKKTAGLNKIAGEHDSARRQRAKNFAQRKSIGLQNRLNQAGLTGLGTAMSHLNGTRVAAADKREQSRRDKLLDDSVESINKAHEDKQRTKRNNSVTAKTPDVAKQAATTSNTLNSNQAANVASTLGAAAIATTTSTGKPTISGRIMVKYMAMTGRDLDGKLLDSATYQTVIRYANAHNILNNTELNTAIYNVQRNGDKFVREEFINGYSCNTRASSAALFANDKSKKDFIDQTGDFSRVNLDSMDKVQRARTNMRREFTNTMDVNTYADMNQSRRVELIDQTKNGRDDAGIKSINKINNLVVKYSNVRTFNPTTVKHAYNIKSSFAGWRSGIDDGNWRKWW